MVNANFTCVFNSEVAHLWGHFCLGFGGQKLITNTECIGRYGLQDGDAVL